MHDGLHMAGVHSNPVLSLLVDPQTHLTQSHLLFSLHDNSSLLLLPLFRRLVFCYVQTHYLRLGSSPLRSQSLHALHHSLPLPPFRVRPHTRTRTASRPEVLGLLGLHLLVSWPYTTSAVVDAGQGIPWGGGACLSHLLPVDQGDFQSKAGVCG